MKRFRIGITEAVRKQTVVGAAVVGAVLLVVSLFLHWYAIKGGGQTLSFSGWTSLEFVDGFFLFVAGAALLLAWDRRQGGTRSGIDALALLTAAVMLAILFTKTSVVGMADKTINFANDQGASVPASISTQVGVIVAAIGALTLLLAAFMDSLVEAVGAARPARPAAGPATPPPAAPQPPPVGETQVAPAPRTEPGREAPPSTQSALLPAGWYPDPHRQAAERYWDGAQWTGQTR